MQARSALFDLYGDYLRPRGGRAPVAALVRLLAPLGIAAPAVRTAISRMVRQGWLLPVRLAGGPGYQLTVKAVHRLDEAAARIYRTGRPTWDGHFDLVVLDPARAAGRPRPGRRDAGLPRLRPARPGDLGGPPPAPERSTTCSTRPASAFERFTASHAAGTPARPRWSAGPGTSARSADAYGRFVADSRTRCGTPDRSRVRRGGLRRPVPAGARLADVPVPRPAAAAGAAAAALARHRRGRVLRPPRHPAAAGRRPVRRLLPVRLNRDRAERDAA